MDGAERCLRSDGKENSFPRSDYPPPPPLADELTGTDPRDGVGGQEREREALAIELGAAAGSVEVQIVKAVRPARGRQVRDMDGFDMEEEARLRILGRTRLCSR